MQTKFAIYASKGYVRATTDEATSTTRYNYNVSLSKATPFDTHEDALRAAQGIDRSRFAIHEVYTK